MKKNKIVVPALAIIAFSTAASIAGSVAWFTASRQVTMNAGTYAVVKTTSNLECVVAGGVGTTAALQPGGTNYIVTLAKEARKSKLTDGSFDHGQGKVYKPNATVTGLDVPVDIDDAASVAALEASLLRTTLGTGTTEDPYVDVYTAVTWDITFKVNFGSVPGNVALFLDASASSFTKSGEADLATAKGYPFFYIVGDNDYQEILGQLLQAGLHKICISNFYCLFFFDFIN